ncbi:MAG TPA: branched-chain amino acid ABC transporter permease [Phototrophicaceae bacterium]|nr:branched-chain amino acid ABC transporter permease [Phototrophicaceae bacterium]
MSLPLYALQQLINALSIGSLYALMAVGLAMVFGILRLINFAHGDMMMVAAYIAAFSLLAGIPLPLALAMMVIGTVLVTLVMERVAYRPIRTAPQVAALLTSFAVGQILENSALLASRFARKPEQIAFPGIDFLRGVVTIGAVTIPKVNVVSLALGIILLILLSLFVTRTTLGLSMRAAAEDLQAAQLMGIDTNRVIVTAFVIGAILASVAGLLYAVQAGTINPIMGFSPVLKAFIAAVIGGFGSISGAIVGGFALGLLEVLLTAIPGLGDILPAATTSPGVISFFKTYLPSSLTSYRDAFVFVILILLLLVRPGGILGTTDRDNTR